MKKITSSGRNVEEAIEKALAQLNVSKEQVEITVIEEGKRGFLGIFGGKQAIVEVSIDPIKQAETFLQNVVANMGVDVKIERRIEQDHVQFLFSGTDVSLLIGKRGQTLNALQFLTQVVLNRYTDRPIHVVLDAGDYRKRREETLTRLARNLAKKAIQSGEDISLEPMVSWERKIVHSALAGHEQVRTFSVGVEPNRYVVISPIR
ncbi:spoIIIJ-associated protein [Thermolongibacillus altinsuensis]|uniref:RNA-binding protein KhpB n=1 Tax=Thermolongibacillus altinsuensis TaxID=575256 RepID=A0A4R1QGH1_9BACL|nr:RNA-binding cell elongation regulator Jag/EloR [Thermolongibacillus altinsuensis]TCL52608.1 spoIIIJ-associated protein [Thermolongibacillus altinsuensis]GMB09762.1 Jag protein [Thermolongibacillus altinsuensis]